MNQTAALRRRAPIVELAPELARIETELLEHLGPTPGLLRQVVEGALRAGGKRLRPQLVLTTCAACGGSPAQIEGAHLYAIAVEYLHTATLLHDDLVDGASLRRGEQAAYRRYGPKEAVLGGDLLLARCLSLVSTAPHREAVGILARATERMAIGEALELELSRRADVSEDDYYAFASAKTAALFAAAAELGALAANAAPDVRATLASFGEQLGLAFQVADDILDVASSPEQSGKERGTDLRAGIPTLPVLKALAALHGTAPARAIAQELRGEAPVAAGDAGERHRVVLDLVREPAVRPAVDAACSLVERARRGLRVLAPGAAVDQLHAMALQAAERLA